MGKLLYLYGILPEEENVQNVWPEGKAAIDGKETPFLEKWEGIACVVTEVDEEEFGEEAMEKNSNDTSWIQEKAFHHHEALLDLQRRATILPMKFGTIFESKESLQSMIEEKRGFLVETLNKLEGKEEWNVKAYIDPVVFQDRVAETNENIKAKREEISAMSKGRQYLEKKKLDKVIEEERFREQERKAQEIHSMLREYSVESEKKKNWKKETTGRSDEMSLNAAYLIDRTYLDDFLNRFRSIENDLEGEGWLIEATGPWPAYHFATLDE